VRRPLVWSVVAAMATGGSAAAQTGPVVIAILPFEDRGSYGQDKEVFRALQLGLPATLANELSRRPGVRLADRSRISRTLETQNLGPNARVDAATAARVAREIGARYAITGSFADFYGKFRVDARIVEAESGRILKVVSNKDPGLQDRADLSRIIQALADQVVAEVGLHRSTGRAPNQTPTAPMDDPTRYRP
jgi:TolB-like protein